MIRLPGGLAVAVGLAAGAVLVSQGLAAAAFGAFLLAFAGVCFGSALSLNAQIGLGALFGAGLGLWLPGAAAAMGATGSLFIAALKMLIAPMILFSIVYGIARMGDARALGRLGGRTLALYALTMVLAIATGLLLVNLFQPGAGSGLLESPQFRDSLGSAEALATSPPLGEFLAETAFQVLANPLDSLARGAILPIVVFAIALGIALIQLGTVAEPLLGVLAAAYAAIMQIINWVIRLAPLGILALVGHLLASVGVRELFENLAAFVAVVVGGTLIHALVTLPLVAYLLAGVHPLELLRGLREAMLVAFTTSSSAATLPVTTRCVEQNLAVPPTVSSFVLPLGATVNMDGTALYEAVAAVFVAAVYGIELGLTTQLVIFAVAMATAVGAPGIPSAGMVTMVVVLESVGLPGEAVGLLLPLDRALDTVRTMANVEGDAVVAVCVARSLEPASATSPPRA